MPSSTDKGKPAMSVEHGVPETVAPQTSSGTQRSKAARVLSDFKGRIKPIWCPGCGNFAVLSSLTRALADLNIDPDNLAIVSGIGCSSRLPGFIKCYGYHGAHGRALPSAIGIKAGNPRLTVLAVGGDGDGLSIGIGHFPHAARRNINITYLLLDNRIYGLTKGQTSPTTRQGFRTKTSPHGVAEIPMNPVELAIVFGATFIARGYSGEPKQLRKLTTQAIDHEGFSLVHILSPCLTFAKGSGFEYFDSRVKPLPDDHDPANRQAALMASNDAETIYSGVFYQSQSDEYLSLMQQDGGSRGRELDDSHPRIDVEALIDRFS